MTDDFPLLTEEDAAILFIRCASLIEIMGDGGIVDRPHRSPLPRGVFTCGEAWEVVCALWALLAHQFPDLKDPDSLSETLGRAQRSGVPKEMLN